MSTPNHILSFGTDKDGSQVFIHADLAGLDHLIRSLTHIRQKVAGAHTVHHVKIYGWTSEWAQKHGFRAEPGASPNGGPATALGNSGDTEEPPSVS